MTDTYVPRILAPHILRNGQDKSHLILDQAPCNKHQKTKKKLSEYRIRPIYIPARLTCLLQPADVAWFKSLKAQYRDKWTNWYITSPGAFTKAGNLKSPGYARV